MKCPLSNATWSILIFENMQNSPHNNVKMIDEFEFENVLKITFWHFLPFNVQFDLLMLMLPPMHEVLTAIELRSYYCSDNNDNKLTRVYLGAQEFYKYKTNQNKNWLYTSYVFQNIWLNYTFSLNWILPHFIISLVKIKKLLFCPFWQESKHSSLWYILLICKLLSIAHILAAIESRW